MKQISLILFVALVAVACQPDLPPLPNEKPTTKPTTATTTGTTAPTTTTGGTTTVSTATTGSTTASSTTGATTTAQTTGAGTTTTAGSSTNKGPQPGDIKNRIFQLRQLERVTITGGRQPIDAYVADDEVKTQEGLMWVTDKDLKDSQGMIFVMPFEKIQTFWMQNTLIPLDIIYLDKDAKVVNIVHGKPRDETTLPSTAFALYVLELKDGMAAKLGIGPKTKLNLPKTLKYKSEGGGQGFPGSM